LTTRSRFRRFNLFNSILVVALISLLTGSAQAQRSLPLEETKPGIDQRNFSTISLLTLLGSHDDLEVVYHSETGKVRFIATKSGAAMPQPKMLGQQVSPEVAARTFLSGYGELFGLMDESEELTIMKSKNLKDGRSFARFQQVYNGIPVLGGELIVQMDGGMDVLSVNGEVLPDPDLDTSPRVDGLEARQQALAYISKETGVEVDLLQSSQPELWIYNPVLLGGPGLSENFLTWRMEITSKSLLPIRELVLVDARTGRLVLSFNQADSVKYREIYNNNNDPNQGLPGLGPVRVEGGAATGVPDADNAYDYSGFTYDFYSTYHNRDSIDNLGMKIVSTVKFCDPSSPCPYQNAFWNGQQMTYGQGYSSADDVVAHELTHGVTEYESKLFYYMQSGAINEAFSDIWGEFVDLSYTNGLDNDTPGVRWLMGEDIPGVGASRSMKNPPAYGDPDRTQSPNYDCGPLDGGGVHTNSGVANKAAYLMVDGEFFNGVTVTGIGLTKTAKIWYDVQTNLLTSAGDYQDLFTLLPYACNRLIGTSSITTGDCQEVLDAVTATQMNIRPSCSKSDVPLCDSGIPSVLFYDDLENPVSAKWTWSSLWYYPQSDNPYSWDANYTTSGGYSLWGDDVNYISDTNAAMYNNVYLPVGKTAYLHFNHSYQFEGDTIRFDGSVIEYSLNGGIWVDAGSLITHNGYNGVLSSGYGNPLGGRSAFTSKSYGMHSSRLNLSTLAGNNVRFRYRIGTDSNTSSWGWWIDDVRVYTCSPVTSGLKMFLPIAIQNVSYSPYLFHTSFNNDMLGWLPIYGTWTLSSRYYSTEGVNNQWASASYWQNFSNFLFQVRMRRGGHPNYANTILIRGTPDPLDPTYRNWYSFYAFQYTSSGSFGVWKRVAGGNVVALQNWTSTSAIYKGEKWNILSVYANGSNLSFLINKIPVWSGNDTSLTTGRVGFRMYSTTYWDLLNVDWATLLPYGAGGMPEAFVIGPEQQMLNDAALPGGNPMFSP